MTKQTNQDELFAWLDALEKVRYEEITSDPPGPFSGWIGPAESDPEVLILQDVRSGPSGRPVSRPTMW
jgi:hypothetical protein